MTRDAASFDRLYAELGDPWNYETSPYEAEKYRRCLALLPRARYGAALEAGCAIGVMSGLIATRCDSLLGVDFAPTAVARARARAIANARFETATIPDEWPPGPWDLIVFSEVLYYLSPEGLERTIECVRRDLAPGGACLVAGYTGDTETLLGAGDTQARLFEALAAARPVHRIATDAARGWTAAAFQSGPDSAQGR